MITSLWAPVAGKFAINRIRPFHRVGAQEKTLLFARTLGSGHRFRTREVSGFGTAEPFDSLSAQCDGSASEYSTRRRYHPPIGASCGHCFVRCWLSWGAHVSATQEFPTSSGGTIHASSRSPSTPYRDDAYPRPPCSVLVSQQPVSGLEIPKK